MTKTQYIALRTVIDYEIVTNTENSALAQVVKVLLNSDGEDLTEEEEARTIEKKEYTEAVKAISETVKSKDKYKAALLTGGVAAAVGSTLMTMAANPLIIGMTAEWMSKIIISKKK